MIRKIFNKVILKLFSKLSATTKSHIYTGIRSAYWKNKYSSYREKYSLSSLFSFNGEGVLFYGDGEITIGDNSYVGNYTTIQTHTNCKVSIGKNCAISHNVRIYTFSYESDQDFNIKKEAKSTHQGNVIIGNGVWIGANVLINPGVVIGDNVVIGANTVVTKDLKENSVYGGVPARFIKSKSLNGDS